MDFREIGDKFEVGPSTACKKVNTAGTDENLFRLVPVVGHGARVLPLELAVFKFVFEHQQKAMFRLVPVLGHGTRVLPLELVVPKFVLEHQQNAIFRLVSQVSVPGHQV